ncbi:class I adenylate-forming enzyme family protein [Roseateles toxinivorans]|uniref:Acyl-CoA synthetase (AMP-forming)/AMP-acid ligase II n=1 Tax=Roseateles toxinivorans TaxID=270368 RepID=A0A4R6QSF5_9BURK|nr:class I adenylate-forming enzyme family protein [Roseateles toxinivorans]TDP74464.1 acyl-CoA synthetase (AMP-forming)/AMP-acid ligase II [Roseateles toxinivorans]
MLTEKIFAQARATPDKPAFIHNGAACNYAEFAQRLVQAGAYLSQHVPTTDHPAVPGVAVLCVEHLAQAWVLGIALRRLGLTTVSVASVQEIDGLGLDNVRCLVSWAAESPPDLAALAARTGWPWIKVPTDLGPVAVVGEQAWPATTVHVAGHIIQTSGTTGAYKKILRDAAVEVSTLDLHADINGIDASSLVFVRDFPLWTAGGYRWPLLSWHRGATVVFQQWRDFHVPLLSQPLTHVFATPMTLMFVGDPELPLRRNDAMRLLVTGGAMPRALVAALQQRLTRQVYTVLASTEALTVAATLVENRDDLAWHSVHPAREVQVVDEADRPLPAGQSGLLRIRILDGVSGYLGDEAASQEFFRDGYFYPGDLAVLHADGRLALCGRVTDVINVLGNKIATAPIEAALQQRLEVDAVCLLSLPKPGADDEVHIAIESSRALSQAELQAAANDQLKIFGQVHFHLLKQLPRNRMGKVLRLALRQQLLAGLP